MLVYNFENCSFFLGREHTLVFGSLKVEPKSCRFLVYYQRMSEINNVNHLIFKSVLTLGFSCGQTSINDHLHIQALLKPDVVHHLNNLQNKHILPKIIPSLSK